MYQKNKCTHTRPPPHRATMMAINLSVKNERIPLSFLAKLLFRSKEICNLNHVYYYLKKKWNEFFLWASLNSPYHCLKNNAICTQQCSKLCLDLLRTRIDSVFPLIYPTRYRIFQPHKPVSFGDDRREHTAQQLHGTSP